MFGNDNGKKNLANVAPVVGAQITTMLGETWVFIRQRPEGVEILASENFANDSLAMMHLFHHAQFSFTGALLTAKAKESRIVTLPPGTSLRNP